MMVNKQITPLERPDTIYEPFPVFGSCLDLFTPVDGVPLLATMFYYDTLYYAPKEGAFYVMQ